MEIKQQIILKERKEFLSIRDIAEILSFSYSYTRRKIIHLDKFPAPYILPTGAKRWRREQVINFLEDFNSNT